MITYFHCVYWKKSLWYLTSSIMDILKINRVRHFGHTPFFLVNCLFCCFIINTFRNASAKPNWMQFALFCMISDMEKVGKCPQLDFLEMKMSTRYFPKMSTLFEDCGHLSCTKWLVLRNLWTFIKEITEFAKREGVNVQK